MKTYKHFTIDEFKCKCCGLNLIKPELIDKLDIARDIANIPFKINSGYRCNKHNISIGGSITSSHTKGLAVDISTNSGKSKFIIVNALLKAGFNRIGISNSFIHTDIDEDKIQNVIWNY